MTNVCITDGVTNIGNFAFKYCSGLTSITIPNSITSIGEWVFSDCTALTDVYYNGTNDEWSAITIGEENDCLTSAEIHCTETVETEEPIEEPAETEEPVETEEPIITEEPAALEVPENIMVMTDGTASIIITWDAVEKAAAYYIAVYDVDNNLIGVFADDTDEFAAITDTSYTITALTGGTTYTIKVGATDGETIVWSDAVTVVTEDPAATDEPVITPDEGTLASGSCGDDLIWTFNENGTLTISGNGNMDDYDSEEAPWAEFNDYIISVVTENGAVSVGNFAFMGCENLTSAVIADSVTDIGCGAFENCQSLISVTLSSNLTSIGELAFEGCKALTGMTIPDSVTNIETNAFSSCGSLYITVDENNEYYSSEEGVLFNKDKTVLIRYSKDVVEPEYEIPVGVVSIGDSAFEYCYRLTGVTIPDSVTSIGDSAFLACFALESIVISDNVTSIGDLVFVSCFSLTSVTIPVSVTSIGDYAFWSCDDLADIYYAGTETEWNEIYIGADNQSLTNATIHYNSLPAVTDEPTVSEEPTASGKPVATEVPTALPTDIPVTTEEPTTEDEPTATEEAATTDVPVVKHTAEPTAESTATPNAAEKPIGEPTAAPDETGEPCTPNYAYTINDIALFYDGVVVSVTDNFGDGNGVLITAAYDSTGRLIAVKFINMSNIENGEADIDINTTDAAYISAFVWEDLSEMTALSEKLTV